MLGRLFVCFLSPPCRLPRYLVIIQVYLLDFGRYFTCFKMRSFVAFENATTRCRVDILILTRPRAATIIIITLIEVLGLLPIRALSVKAKLLLAAFWAYRQATFFPRRPTYLS